MLFPRRILTCHILRRALKLLSRLYSQICRENSNLFLDDPIISQFLIVRMAGTLFAERNSLFRKINTRTNIYQIVFENFPYIHSCILTYIHTCIHIYIHKCVHTCLHTYMHTYKITTYMYAYVHTYTRTYVRRYIHSYILTYIYMRTYIRT